MIIGTRDEFERLADYVLRDYLGDRYDAHDPLDVRAFAEDYLKLRISYRRFDPRERVEGMRVGNRILLDDRLRAEGKTGERNFTIAHECGHDLINWQDPAYLRQRGADRRGRRPRGALETEEDFREWQANVVASGLLLRPDLVGWAMYTFTGGERATVFGERFLRRRDRARLRMAADYLGVSGTCLMCRLERLGRVDRRPLGEYEPASDIPIPWRW